MAVTTVTILAPHDGYDIPDGILRPATRVTWTGGTGPTFDVEVQWDVSSGFGTGSLITVTDSNVGVGARTLVPTSDLPPGGSTWWTRARVRDDSDAVWSSYTAAKQINFQDPRTFKRFLYLNANVGVAFGPIDEPAGGWGVSEGGTEFADGESNMMNRNHYLYANAGVGYRYSDRPGPVGTEDEDWGVPIGGTWGDGDEKFFSRFLYVDGALDTTLPAPFIFHLLPDFGRPGEGFAIHGWGFRPSEQWAEGIAPVLASGTWAGTLATLTDGHLPVQSGEERPDVAWFSGGTNDPVFTIDLATPRMINEVRVWTKIGSAFVSCVVEHADSGLGGPWTSIGTLLGSAIDSAGWVTLEQWSTGGDFGTHRYWRLSFTDIFNVGEIEINRRMTVDTGDIEARFDDTVTDWLMAVSSLNYGVVVAQSPDSDETGGLARVVNTFPATDLESNEESYVFLEGIAAVDVGLLIKVFDRDAPEQLLAIAGDAVGAQFHDVLNTVGSAEFTVPAFTPFFEEEGVTTKWNPVRMYLDQVERWWGFVTFSRQRLVDIGGRKQQATRFVCKHGLEYLRRGKLFPFNWPSMAEPVNWEFEFVTAGQILIDTITACQARGTIPRVTWSFTELVDSNGDPWEPTFFVSIPVGTSILEVVEYVCSLGADVKFDSQFILHAYKQRGFDLPTRPEYQPMIVGHSVQVLDETVDFQDPVNVAMIGYGASQMLVYEDPVSVAEWERFEEFTQTQATEATTAQRAAEAIVALGGQPLDQISVAVMRIADEWVPYEHGDLGDTVRVVSRAPEHNNFDKQYRIRGIVVDAGNSRRPQIILDLNSIRLEALIQLQIQGAWAFVSPGITPVE